MDGLSRATALIRNGGNNWALTGAGVSTASGIPDFRGPGGLWENVNAERVSSIEGLREEPESFYRFWLWRFEVMRQAVPNPVHTLLADLESARLLSGVITQNIDGLHRAAGSRSVLEVHGHVRSGSCLGCGHAYPYSWITAQAEAAGVARCGCGGLVKPDVVLFGEELPATFDAAQRAAADADVLLVMGTSLMVWPVAGLVPLAVSRGAALIIANAQPTAYDRLAEVVLTGDVIEACAELRTQLLEEA